VSSVGCGTSGTPLSAIHVSRSASRSPSPLTSMPRSSTGCASKPSFFNAATSSSRSGVRGASTCTGRACPAGQTRKLGIVRADRHGPSHRRADQGGPDRDQHAVHGLSRHPFGGYKQSGFGRELGLETLDLYLETKSVLVLDVPEAVQSVRLVTRFEGVTPSSRFRPMMAVYTDITSRAAAMMRGCA